MKFEKGFGLRPEILALIEKYTVKEVLDVVMYDRTCDGGIRDPIFYVSCLGRKSPIEMKELREVERGCLNNIMRDAVSDSDGPSFIDKQLRLYLEFIKDPLIKPVCSRLKPPVHFQSLKYLILDKPDYIRDNEWVMLAYFCGFNISHLSLIAHGEFTKLVRLHRYQWSEGAQPFISDRVEDIIYAYIKTKKPDNSKGGEERK